MAICSRGTVSKGQNRGPLRSQLTVTQTLAMALMSPSWPLDTSTNTSPGNVERPIARSRKVAICSRLTRPKGPYKPPPNPSVIPAWAKVLISASWISPESSVKMSVETGGKPKARAKKVAICPLMTAWPGQKKTAGFEQPAVIPAAAIASMFPYGCWRRRPRTDHRTIRLDQPPSTDLLRPPIRLNDLRHIPCHYCSPSRRTGQGDRPTPRA